MGIRTVHYLLCKKHSRSAASLLMEPNRAIVMCSMNEEPRSP